MLYSPVFAPLAHGAAGILDELLLFGAPLVVVVIILAIASRRARKNTSHTRERMRSAPEATTTTENTKDANSGANP